MLCSCVCYLFNADNSYVIVHSSVVAFPGHFIVDLTGAENHPLHLLWSDSSSTIIWD